MDTLNFGVLDPIKLPIAKKLYKAHYPAGKPKSDERILTLSRNQSLSALVRFRTIEQYRLMTGMLVLPEQRGAGLGHQLMTYLEQGELKDGDYCFALSHLESFYSQHGFETIDEDSLPNPLKQLFSRYIGGGKSLLAMRYIDPR
ncbi:predicted acyltransferase [Vibrio variabilis]|uniref:Predicted acyltransferase n=1 Tax=Vibrio variabilis TaxID=990271 RepID=A0ABQ0JKJ3_9VIBR|nr:predicted acyltransferase [Vibrio variabilis]